MNGWIYIHTLDPVLVRLGPLGINWYGLMWALAFLSGYWFLMRSSRRPGAPVPTEEVPNLITYLIIGVVLGGRLGWVIFYGGLPYLIAPYRVLEIWRGGMSFHGGLLGFVFAVWLYSRWHHTTLLRLSDFIIPWVPMGLFFGRIGNFINGELFGKPTDGSWGVIFPHDPQRLPRHPSQLYEAALEGLVIFAVLMLMRSRTRRTGHQAALFLLLYGAARFSVEFVRLPDADIGYLWRFLTMGQLLSLPMLAIGLAWTIWLFARKDSAEERAA